VTASQALVKSLIDVKNAGTLVTNWLSTSGAKLAKGILVSLKYAGKASVVGKASLASMQVYIDVKNGADFKESIFVAGSEFIGGIEGGALGAAICGPEPLAFGCVLFGGLMGATIAHFAAHTLIAAEKKYDAYIFKFIKERIK